MDRPSEIRPVSERKALEDLLDDIRELLADREEVAKRLEAGHLAEQGIRLCELAVIESAIKRLAERRGLRWGPEEAFLDGFEDLADTEVAPDQAIPYRLTDGGAE